MMHSPTEPDSSVQAASIRMANGDQAAFKEIHQSLFNPLLRFALAMVKTREAAEEIVEDVFVKIWQNRSGLPKIQNLKVYLYKATKNASLNYLSKKAHESITEPFDHISIDLSASTMTPEDIMITAEMYRRVVQAVDQLPPRCKMIFKLIREDGLRYREVSEILNISVNTIDTQMAIAVKKIAQALQVDLSALHGKNRISKKS